MACALLGATVAVASADPRASAVRPAVGTTVVAARAVAPAGSPGACADDAFRVRGQRWTDPYRWRFHASSTPDGITRPAASAALQRAVANITGSDNDCGLADRVGATAAFRGITDRRPNVRPDATCGDRDGRNTIGFGRLPLAVAGATCWWYIGNRIIEAEMRLNSRFDWATSLASCSNALMVEAVATHEAGHIFGLGHVGEAGHGRLTMSKRLDGSCQNSESTLGLGDVRGLRALY
jgi:hypothetical protein